MSRTIHELRALITAKASQFFGVADRVVSHTMRIGRAWNRAAKDVSRAATRITVAVAGVGGVAVKRFAELERTMTRVGAVTNTLGTKAFARLEKQALKMGATTEFTANQSAQAMESLGLAGLKTTEIISALPGALQLATAAQVDISTAADIAAKSMRAFGLDASELGRINDTLVSAFTRSNTDIRQLAEALKPVGPVAKAAGVSLEDTTAILAKMADAGFQGSFGGTALRTAFIRLAAPSREGAKILKDLGVNAIDPLFVKLKKIEAGIKNATTENEKLNIAAQLFGTRGGPAMLAALDAGVEEIAKFSQGLKDAGGIAKRIEQANLNTLTGQFNILKSAIDGVFLATGKDLNPVFRKLIEDLTEFINLHADDIATELANAMRFLAKFGREAFVAFTEFGPAIWEASEPAREFVLMLLRFLKEHPRILSALIALKVSGFMGLNTAILSTVAALGKTFNAFAFNSKGAFVLGARLKALGVFFGRIITVWVPQMIGGLAALLGKTSALSGSAKLLSIALKGLLVGALAVGMYKLADAVGLFGKKAESAAERQERLNRALEMNRKVVSQAVRGQASLPAGATAENIQGRISGLQRTLNAAKSRRKGAEQEARRLGVDKRSGGQKVEDWISSKLGEGSIDSERKAQRDQALQRMRQAQQQIEEIQKAIDDLKAAREQVKQARATEDAKMSDAARIEMIVKSLRRNGADEKAARKFLENPRFSEGIRSGVLSQLGFDTEAQKQQKSQDTQKVNEFLRDRELQQREKQAPGLRDAFGLIDAGASGNQLSRFFQTLGVGQGKADLMGGRIAGLGDKGLQKTSIEQFLQSVQRANEARERERQKIEAQKQAIEDNNRQVDAFKDKLNDLANTGPLSIDAVRKLEAKLSTLQKQMQNGSITSQQFAKSMKDLADETQKAVQAAEQKAQQERRERMQRLLSGRGTAEDRAFLQAQVAARRQEFLNQRLDQGFSSLIDRLAGVANGLNQFAGGVQRAGGAVQQFVQPMIRRASPEQVGRLMGQLNQAFGSRSGRAAILRNNIALLQQEANRLKGPSADSIVPFSFGRQGYRARRAVEERIAAMEQQLRQLSIAPPPAITGFSTSGGFSDPGLQTETGGNGVTVNVSVQEMDGQRLLDEVNRGLMKQGHSRFF